MSKKSVISVNLLCTKCEKKAMKLVAGIEGIKSIVLDSSKHTITVVGNADPVKVLGRLRKFKKSAEFVTVGSPTPPPPPKDGKTAEEQKNAFPTPWICHECHAWYDMGGDYNQCSIL